MNFIALFFGTPFQMLSIDFTITDFFKQRLNGHQKVSHIKLQNVLNLILSIALFCVYIALKGSVLMAVSYKTPVF